MSVITIAATALSSGGAVSMSQIRGAGTEPLRFTHCPSFRDLAPGRRGPGAFFIQG